MAKTPRPSARRPVPPFDMTARFTPAHDVEEEWRQIPGWPDYAVSDLGRVKRLTSRTCAKAGTILRTPLRSKKRPYPCVDLSRPGEKKHTVAVHNLVALAFIGEPPIGYEVNHIDGKKANPRLDNLEYITSSENSLHAYQNGLQDATGENNGKAILTEAQVLDIRRRASGMRGEQSEFAREFGVCPTTIRDVLSRRTWVHI